MSCKICDRGTNASSHYVMWCSTAYVPPTSPVHPPPQSSAWQHTISTKGLVYYSQLYLHPCTHNFTDVRNFRHTVHVHMLFGINVRTLTHAHTHVHMHIIYTYHECHLVELHEAGHQPLDDVRVLVFDHEGEQRNHTHHQTIVTLTVWRKRTKAQS